MTNTKNGKILAFVLAGIALLVLPLLLQATGSNSWARIVDIALLYVLLALGLNIVVGYAGLLDLAGQADGVRAEARRTHCSQYPSEAQRVATTRSIRREAGVPARTRRRRSISEAELGADRQRRTRVGVELEMQAGERETLEVVAAW